MVYIIAREADAGNEMFSAGEKATKKKVICVKMKPRNSVQTAVCEVIMLSEKRSIPKDFTVKGPR